MSLHWRVGDHIRDDGAHEVGDRILDEDWSRGFGDVAIPVEILPADPDKARHDEELRRGRRTVTVRPNRWTYYVTFTWVHPKGVADDHAGRHIYPSSWTRTVLTKRGVRRWIARRNRQYDQQLLEERSTITMAV